MTASNTHTHASRELMERVYASVAKGDGQALLAAMSDDIIIHEPPFLPYGGTYRGHKELANLFAQIPKFVDVRKLKVDRLIADGDHVIGILRMPDLKTGEELLVAEESIIRDGKIVEMYIYFHETRSLLAQP